jgi:hypothetical protein
MIMKKPASSASHRNGAQEHQLGRPDVDPEAAVRIGDVGVDDRLVAGQQRSACSPIPWVSWTRP